MSETHTWAFRNVETNEEIEVDCESFDEACTILVQEDPTLDPSEWTLETVDGNY